MLVCKGLLASLHPRQEIAKYLALGYTAQQYLCDTLSCSYQPQQGRYAPS